MSAYGSEIARVRQDLSVAEAQLRDYQARLGKPFLHDAYLSELTVLRDQFGLSASHGPDAEGGPSVAEIAAQVKSLKAAHNIEATPQRARQKHSAAEKPITAGIRRRTECIPAPEAVLEINAPAKAGASLTAPGLKALLPRSVGLMTR